MLDYSKINLVKSTVSKRGLQMFYYYSEGASRWIRLKKDVAEHLIATEQVEDVTGQDLILL